MTNSQRLAKVRARLLRWIADHEAGDAGHEQSSEGQSSEGQSSEGQSSEGQSSEGQSIEGSTGDSADLSILRETILIRGEFFCGRRFYTANHYAVWFIEEDQLKIYQNQGELLCILSGGQIENDHQTETDGRSPSILKLPESNAPSPDSQESTRRAA